MPGPTKRDRKRNQTSQKEEKQDRKKRKKEEKEKEKKLKQKKKKQKQEKDSSTEKREGHEEKQTDAITSTTGEPLFDFQRKRDQQRKRREELIASPPLIMLDPSEIVKTRDPKPKGPITREVQLQQTHSQAFDEDAKKVREVFDPATGRVRLVRGEGEIIESIVSHKEQQRIQRWHRMN